MKTEFLSNRCMAEQPSVMVGTKRYQFAGHCADTVMQGFDGLVYPYLCSYIFTGRDQLPFAGIVDYPEKEPVLMDAGWNDISAKPILKPEFTSHNQLGIGYTSKLVSESRQLLTLCYDAHHSWSSAYALKHCHYDRTMKVLTLFGKTFLLSERNCIPTADCGVIIFDSIEGFIFIDQDGNPYLSLIQGGSDKYFSSAIKIDGKFKSTFCLSDCDSAKLGGDTLLDLHRTSLAQRVYSILLDELTNIEIGHEYV